MPKLTTVSQFCTSSERSGQPSPGIAQPVCQEYLAHCGSCLLSNTSEYDDMPGYWYYTALHQGLSGSRTGSEQATSRLDS